MAKRRTKDMKLPTVAAPASPDHTAEKLSESDRRDIYILVLEEQNLANTLERVREQFLAKRQERSAKVRELCAKHAAAGLDPVTGALTREPAPQAAQEPQG